MRISIRWRTKVARLHRKLQDSILPEVRVGALLQLKVKGDNVITHEWSATECHARTHINSRKIQMFFETEIKTMPLSLHITHARKQRHAMQPILIIVLMQDNCV